MGIMAYHDHKMKRFSLSPFMPTKRKAGSHLRNKSRVLLNMLGGFCRVHQSSFNMEVNRVMIVLSFLAMDLPHVQQAPPQGQGRPLERPSDRQHHLPPADSQGPAPFPRCLRRGASEAEAIKVGMREVRRKLPARATPFPAPRVLLLLQLEDFLLVPGIGNGQRGCSLHPPPIPVAAQLQHRLQNRALLAVGSGRSRLAL